MTSNTNSTSASPSVSGEHIVNQVKLPIEFSDNAAKKVANLILEEENMNLKLRVFITGGGCSGFQYGFTFDETVNDDDMVIEKKITLPSDQADQKENDEGASGQRDKHHRFLTISLLIDSTSFQYLIGSTINYKEDLQGSRFVITNPNASTTCSCGASFSI